MKRSARWLIVCVSLGVVTTIAVAWACAAWVDPYTVMQPSPRKSGGATNGRHYAFWIVGEHEAFGTVRTHSAWANLSNLQIAKRPPFFGPPEPLIPKWAAFLVPSADIPAGLNHVRVADARGWPFLAMWSGLSYDGQLQPPSKVPTIMHGLVVNPNAMSGPSPGTTVRMLPLALIWGGFLADIALYSLGWLVLLMLTVAGRRALRSRQGCCVICGYDLRGTPQGNCPECGSAITN
ncbi:MAG: hypothetical protein V3T53_10725 [Phycisphaerales bacterium]